MKDRALEFVAIPFADDTTRAMLGVRALACPDDPAHPVALHEGPPMIDDIVLIEMLAASMNATVAEYQSRALN